MTVPVVSAHTGRNADLIRDVARLYAPPGSLIADVTYGKGSFWAKCTGRDILASDIQSSALGKLDLIADLRHLPYADASMDVVVLDPPYVHNSGHHGSEDEYAATSTRYNARATTAGMYNADIMNLYRDGLREAYRVLDPDGGTCWVKCKDEVEREVQRWSHIAIYGIAMNLGFCARDLFILSGTTSPQRWPDRVQRHARKTHSYLWIFQRPDERYAKLLSKTPPGRLA